MLILSRRQSERICLGDNIVLTIVHVSGDKVRIGVEAPANVKILRTELERFADPPSATEPVRGSGISLYQPDDSDSDHHARTTTVVEVQRRAA